jgi:hypothetical protein
VVQGILSWQVEPTAASSDGFGMLGPFGGRRRPAYRRLSPTESRKLNVNYPIWPDPAYTPDTSETMRRHLQSIYDAKGLSAVPQPQGVAGDVSPEPSSCRAPRPSGRGANARAARRRRGHRPRHRGPRPELMIRMPIVGYCLQDAASVAGLLITECRPMAL